MLVCLILTRSLQGPSSEQHKRNQDRLQRRRQWLSDKLQADSLASRMFQQGALTWNELEKIRKSATSAAAADALVDVLVRSKSDDVFRCFKKTLRQTKQDDVYLTLADIG